MEATEHDGLTVADNVVHEPEGYKPVYLASGGSFATTGSLGASTATITSLVAKPVGPGNDLFCAWLSNNTLQFGINGVTATTASTGYPLSFATTGSQQITAFDVCEYGGKIFFTAQAQQTQTVPSATATLTLAGYMDY